MRKNVKKNDAWALFYIPADSAQMQWFFLTLSADYIVYKRHGHIYAVYRHMTTLK